MCQFRIFKHNFSSVGATGPKISNFSRFLRFARAVVMETSWGTPKFSNFSKKKLWLLFTSVGMYKKLSKMIGRKSENSGQSNNSM